MRKFGTLVYFVEFTDRFQCRAGREMKVGHYLKISCSPLGVLAAQQMDSSVKAATAQRNHTQVTQRPETKMKFQP